MEIRLDKRSRWYLTCYGCGTRAFVRSGQAVGNYTAVAQLLSAAGEKTIRELNNKGRRKLQRLLAERKAGMSVAAAAERQASGVVPQMQGSKR